MTTLNLLKVWFDIAIKHRDLPTFKSALQQGRIPAPVLKGVYPLIQYKTRFYKGRPQAMLVVMGDKIIELKEQLSGDKPRIHINGKEQTLEVAGLKLMPFPLRTDKGCHTYNLFNYQAFTADQYADYLKLESPTAQNAFLQQHLLKDLETFVQAVGWELDPPIIVKQLQLRQPKPKVLPFKDGEVQCFDLRFRTNMWIPEHIGLGKGVSLGFGVLRLPRRVEGRTEKKWKK